jgi:hypothetical protein
MTSRRNFFTSGSLFSRHPGQETNSALATTAVLLLTAETPAMLEVDSPETAMQRLAITSTIKACLLTVIEPHTRRFYREIEIFRLRARTMVALGLRESTSTPSLMQSSVSSSGKSLRGRFSSQPPSRSHILVRAATIESKMTGTSFLRPHLLKLAAYTPIEPFEILSARYGRKPEDIIKYAWLSLATSP